jgi:CelD/BcsL family acetyltransferase involved in cellulose biosynthesis
VEVRVERLGQAGHLDRLVAEDASATFFHTPVWSRFIESEFEGHRSAVLTVREGPETVAFLPFVSRSRLGLRLIESMPFGTYGGPVLGRTAPPEAADALVSAFARLAGSPAVVMAQLVDVSGRCLDASGAFERSSGTMQVVDLTGGYEAVLAGFRPSARNKLKKAARAGVTVRRASDVEDFRRYHRLLEESAKRWGAPTPHGVSFFEDLARLKHDGVQMWLAVRDGDVIGGDLNFALNRTIMNWGNASSEAGRTFASNNLLHAHAMRVGAEEGYATFNMGASDDLPGVRAFKTSLGARDAAYTFYRMTKPLYRAAQWAAHLRR